MRKLSLSGLLAVGLLCIGFDWLSENLQNWIGKTAAQAMQRNMESLGRGVVAVRSSSSQVFISWRLLGLDPAGIGFNVYRSANGGAAVRLNGSTLTGGANFTDSNANLSQSNAYFVRPVINGVEEAPSGSFTLPANTPVRQFMTIPLQSNPGTTVHFVWVGDLDGDGEYDFICDRLGTRQFIEAYRRDGAFLWRVNFGPNSENQDNIEPGASAISVGHNDGVTVYDLDSDGRAEVIIKSANGVVFGNGQTLNVGDNTTQFISVLNGLTGAERARATIPNPYFADGSLSGHMGVAYLDGVNPSIVFKGKNRVGSGGFNLIVTTWRLNGSNLTQQWSWQRGGTNAPDFHQIRIADVDRNGTDEICDGGYVLNANGTFRYAVPGVIHGDRFHISDLDPNRPGLEGFGIQQNNPSGLLYYVYNPSNGAIIRNHFGGVEDTARGIAADIDPRYPGYEYWSFHGIHRMDTGAVISPDPLRPWPNFRIWWDGDVMSENLNREIVEKWNHTTSANTRLLTASNDGAEDSWRDAAQFYGDIMGDWREEVVYANNTDTALMIYTTTTPTNVRLYTLPHNPLYRACMTVKGYLQSHLVDYYLGEGMSAPPTPNIRYVGATGGGPDTYQAESASIGGGVTIDNDRSGFNGAGFANFPVNGGIAQWSGVDGDGGGAKTLMFRYALGASAARTGRLTVNGVAQNITFASTGGWTVWQTHTVAVTLLAGQVNTITLESTGADLANIDQVVVP
jgi:rhamnogalacturonan endolyase